MRKLLVALILGALVAISFAMREPSETKTSSAAVKPDSSFCNSPKPVEAPTLSAQARKPLSAKPVTDIFADFDASKQLWLNNRGAVPKAKIEELLARLYDTHGTSDCQWAEDRLRYAKIMYQDALNVEVEKAEATRIANDVSGRRAWADEMERRFLSEGKDFSFAVSGDKGTSLRVKWVLLGRPFVYKVANETDFLTNARKRGFKRVTFTDGYDSSWTYDLTK